ncbi:MAG: DUF4424 family protein [Hyphomicrobium sp.]
MIRLFTAALALSMLGASASANDSTAELAAGGLVLKKTADIEMQSEDLFVSAEKVRVAYRFLNTSAQDISTVVAFPLPDIGSEEEADFAIPEPGADDFCPSRRRSTASPLQMTLEQKVVARDADQTALIRALKLPLSPIAAADALDRLDAPTQDKLIALGLAEAQEMDVGQGMQRHLAPAWTLKTTYFWTQVFPAGKPLRVEHAYTPSVGSSVDTMITHSDLDPELLAHYQTRYCTDGSFIAAAKAKKTPLFEQWISYVLTTGANWAKPIGSFTLTVDKGSAANLVSFCGEDVSKIGATAFRMSKQNYTPAADLHILILKPRAAY